MGWRNTRSMLCKFLGIPSKMAITAHRSLYGQARMVSTNINNNICNDNNNNNNNNTNDVMKDLRG